MNARDKKSFQSLGHHLKPEVWIGKEGITAGIIRTIENSFRTKELVKVKILENCSMEKAEVAQQLSRAVSAEVIQILGNVILFHKPLAEGNK